MMCNLATQVKLISAKKAELDSKRPLPESMAESLRDKLYLEWTYHSNAIEGNTLTLRETQVALQGLTVGGKTVLEHLEALNHREAIFYIEDIIQQRENLSEWQIRSLHQLVMK